MTPPLEHRHSLLCLLHGMQGGPLRKPQACHGLAASEISTGSAALAAVAEAASPVSAETSYRDPRQAVGWSPADNTTLFMVYDKYDALHAMNSISMLWQSKDIPKVGGCTIPWSVVLPSPGPEACLNSSSQLHARRHVMPCTAMPEAVYFSCSDHACLLSPCAMQIFLPIAQFHANTTLSQAALAPAMTAPSMGAEPTTRAPFTLPPWNVSGDVLLLGPPTQMPVTMSLDLDNSTAPLFRAVPLPRLAFGSFAFSIKSFDGSPFMIMVVRLVLKGLGVAPLSSEPGAPLTALPMWALKPAVTVAPRAGPPGVFIYNCTVLLPQPDYAALLIAAQRSLAANSTASSSTYGNNTSAVNTGQGRNSNSTGAPFLGENHVFLGQLQLLLDGIQVLELNPAHLQGASFLNASTQTLHIAQLVGWGVTMQAVYVQPELPLPPCYMESYLDWRGSGVACRMHGPAAAVETGRQGHGKDRSSRLGLVLGLGLGVSLLLLAGALSAALAFVIRCVWLRGLRDANRRAC